MFGRIHCCIVVSRLSAAMIRDRRLASKSSELQHDDATSAGRYRPNSLANSTVNALAIGCGPPEFSGTGSGPHRYASIVEI